MKPISKPIEVPNLPLNACSVEEHCKALIKMKHVPYWWYQIGRNLGNYSLPFQDKERDWWYQIRRGFCWPVETYKMFEYPCTSLPLKKSFIGYQYLVKDKALVNSQFIINTNFDLKSYGLNVLKKDRRKSIRKGLKNCSLSIVSKVNDEILESCRLAWKELTIRKNWKHPVSKKIFCRIWEMIPDVPGVSIILARDKASGQIAGFFITKIIGDTVCGDTIAVRDHMLKKRVNDALRYTFLINAAKIPGVTKACCSVKSNDINLEKFKTSLGYQAISFHQRTTLRFGCKFLLKSFFNNYYKRMIGEYD